jgi:Stress responsive A/B Barrel Domain
MSYTRRKFLALVSLLSFGFVAKAAPKNEKPLLVHHVFFWLKNPDSVADRDQLIQGIKTLGSIRQVKAIHVGVPADTEKRDVVDGSYSVSELLFFDSVEDQKVYQDHAVHQKFVQDHSPLWSKVLVYDSMEVGG